jgi:hypothetical protein
VRIGRRILIAREGLTEFIEANSRTGITQSVEPERNDAPSPEPSSESAGISTSRLRGRGGSQAGRRRRRLPSFSIFSAFGVSSPPARPVGESVRRPRLRASWMMSRTVATDVKVSSDS